MTYMLQDHSKKIITTGSFWQCWQALYRSCGGSATAARIKTMGYKISIFPL